MVIIYGYYLWLLFMVIIYFHKPHCKSTNKLLYLQTILLVDDMMYFYKTNNMNEMSKPILNDFKYNLNIIEINISIEVYNILLDEIKRPLIGEIFNIETIFWFCNMGI